jgi:hypothetical protein
MITVKFKEKQAAHSPDQLTRLSVVDVFRIIFFTAGIYCMILFTLIGTVLVILGVMTGGGSRFND